MEHFYNHASVAVLDRHALFRHGVVGLLRDARPDWRSAEAGTLEALKAILIPAPPTVVLVDLAHPDVVEAGGLGDLVAAHPEHMFVALSDDDDGCAVLDCLTTGARGYILRTAQTMQFLRALETIMDGGIYSPVSLKIERVLAEAPRVEAVEPPPLALTMLTDRQRDVFDLLREGCPTKTIARRLDLAVGTVKVHLAGIYRALGVTSRLEAVTIAHRIYA